VRRLPLLVAVLVFVDTMLYAALTPLLPHLAHELSLSKTQAGVLVAAYAAGALVGGLPGGMAAVRFGSRRTVLFGLGMMGLASLGFAFAGSFPALLGARLAQGAGSACTWAGAFAWLLSSAPPARHGALIGNAMAAAVFGALFGPVVGTAAALLGRAPTFACMAGLALVLGTLTWRLRAVQPVTRAHTSLGPALANRRFRGGLALLALGSLLFGIIAVLAPLHLAHAGWSAGAIGAVWLVSAAIEGVQSPLLGRLSDRRGALPAVRVALAAGAVLSLGLATGAQPLLYAPLTVAAGVAYGALFTPSFTLIASGSEQVGLAQGMAFGLMNAAWAVGAMLGPAAAGAIAAATGDWIPFAISACMCVAALAATGRSRPAPIPAPRVRAQLP
jgi:MFS family permease